MPDANLIVLEHRPGADTKGYAGLKDEVDNHWGMLFKAAVLSTLLSVGAEAGTSQTKTTWCRQFVAAPPKASARPDRRSCSDSSISSRR